MIHLTRALIRRWLDALLHIHDTPERTAAAFALGVFFGFSPFLGLHTHRSASSLAFVSEPESRRGAARRLLEPARGSSAPYYAFDDDAGRRDHCGHRLPPDFRERLAELFELSFCQGEFWRELGVAAAAAALAVHRRVDHRRAGAGRGRLSAGAGVRRAAAGASRTSIAPRSCRADVADSSFDNRRQSAAELYNLQSAMLSSPARSGGRRSSRLSPRSAFVSLYEVTMLDSRVRGPLARSSARADVPPPAPGARLPFTRDRVLQGADDRVRRRRRRPASPPPIRRCCRSARSSRSTRRDPSTTASTRPGHRARRSRAARSTSTCGAATRRSQFGRQPVAPDRAAPRLEPAARRRRASSIACSASRASPNRRAARCPSRPLPMAVRSELASRAADGPNDSATD